MLCHSQPQLSFTTLLLGVTCLFRTKPETPPPNCVGIDPPNPEVGTAVLWGAVATGGAVLVPCTGQLPQLHCVNLNFGVNLNFCISCLCVVLFCSIVGWPGLPPPLASGCTLNSASSYSQNPSLIFSSSGCEQTFVPFPCFA